MNNLLKRISFLTAVVMVHTFSLLHAEENEIFIAFNTEDNVLYEHFKKNESSLKQIETIISSHEQAIRDNKAHLRLVAFIPYMESPAAKTINDYSVLAAVVRSYIINKFPYVRDRVSFYFKTYYSTYRRISISYIDCPIAPSDHTQIYYTKSSDPQIIDYAVSQYKPLPRIKPKEIVR